MTLNFGFSYVGLIFLSMLIIPNIVWTKNLPKDYEKYAKKENKVAKYQSLHDLKSCQRSENPKEGGKSRFSAV